MNLKLNGNGQPKPYLRFALLAVAVVLVAVLLYRQVDRLGGPRQSVWVAKAALARGSVLKTDDLELKRVRAAGLPAGAVTDVSTVVGKRLRQGKAAGSPLAVGDLARGDRGSIAGLVPEGRVLMTLRVASKSLPLEELRRGDRLDLLATGRGGSGSVATDVFFVGWIRSGQENGGRE